MYQADLAVKRIVIARHHDDRPDWAWGCWHENEQLRTGHKIVAGSPQIGPARQQPARPYESCQIFNSRPLRFLEPAPKFQENTQRIDPQLRVLNHYL